MLYLLTRSGTMGSGWRKVDGMGRGQFNEVGWEVGVRMGGAGVAGELSVNGDGSTSGGKSESESGS